jgi:NAD(P)-dependent dehydrogenase (short-subunit alcohol dehydrogenase family)
MTSSLADRVLVVTGVSSGIGRATALEAARAGMHVVITGRREERLREAARQIEALGRRAVIVSGDVADAGFSERLLDEAERSFGHFDAVFANAGYGCERRVLDYTEEEFRRMFEVNLFASAHLVREAARRLVKASRRGHLLMCSSCVARFTLPGYGPYSATKAAQAMLCRALRYELKEHGIEVSSVHPVTTTTEFFEVAADTKRSGRPSVAEHAPRFVVQPPERVARAVIRCLLRPRAEVWTSLSARLGAGLFTAFPGLADLFLARHLRYIPSRSCEAGERIEGTTPGTSRPGAQS